MLHDQLIQHCVQAFQKNKISTATGSLIPAGAHQFGTLWMRDFCHAVPGLLKAEEDALVEFQLKTFLKFQRADGLFCRGLDVVPPQLRVVAALFARPLLKIKKFQYADERIKAEYLGEHKTPAFDSNILLALTFELIKSSHTSTYASAQGALQRGLEYYRPFLRDGLFHQPGFSDWMDSLRREGPQLYFHILFLKYLKLSGRQPFWLPKHFSQTVFEKFLAGSRWRRESTESLLWILEDPELCGPLPADEVWSELKNRGWGVPLPLQPDNEISWTTKFVGLRHYHDGFRWSWLLGETLKVAKKQSRPESLEIEKLTLELLNASGGVSEIYEKQKIADVKTWVYKSEKPFTWGAGKIREAL